MCLAVCAAWLAFVSDTYIQINSMTGAGRTRTRQAYLFSTPWKVESTWVAESAKRQNINTEGGWQTLSVLSMRGPLRSRACSFAPASYIFGAIPAEYFEFQSTAEIDQFVREFVVASEPERKEMIESLPK